MVKKKLEQEIKTLIAGVENHSLQIECEQIARQKR